MNPVTRGWALCVRDGVDRARGCIEAIRVGHGRQPELPPGRPVSLREDLARFMGEHPAATTSATTSRDHRPAALHPIPPAVPNVTPIGGSRRSRPRRRRPAVSWLAAGGVAGAAVLGSLAQGLVTRTVSPTASAIVPRGAGTIATSLRTVPAAPLEMPPETTRVTAMPPASPPAAATTLALPPPSRPRIRPTVAVPAVLTVAVARPRGTTTVEPLGMQWDVPVGPMSPLVTFTVENTGHVPVAIGVVSTTDPAFHITQDSCSRTRLAPSDTCHVTVQFQADRKSVV